MLEPSFQKNTLLHRSRGLYVWNLRGEGGGVFIKELLTVM